jgi:hypothetical protein
MLLFPAKAASREGLFPGTVECALFPGGAAQFSSGSDHWGQFRCPGAPSGAPPFPSARGQSGRAQIISAFFLASGEQTPTIARHISQGRGAQSILAWQLQNSIRTLRAAPKGRVKPPRRGPKVQRSSVGPPGRKPFLLPEAGKEAGRRKERPNLSAKGRSVWIEERGGP